METQKLHTTQLFLLRGAKHRVGLEGGDRHGLRGNEVGSLQPNRISFVVLPACGTGFYMKSEK